MCPWLDPLLRNVGRCGGGGPVGASDEAGRTIDDHDQQYSTPASGNTVKYAGDRCADTWH